MQSLTLSLTQLVLGEQTLLKCGITEALASQAYGWTGITITVIDTRRYNPRLLVHSQLTQQVQPTHYTHQTKVGTYTLTTQLPTADNASKHHAAIERGATIYKGTIMLASTETSTFLVT